MTAARLRALPIFWQVLLLLLSSLAVTQLVTIGLLMMGPPPRPDFTTLQDIADALDPAAPPARRDAGMIAAGNTAAPPVPEAAMMGDPVLSARLARYLGVPPARVRLFYEAEQAGNFPFRDRDGARGVPLRHGEALFFNTVVGALQGADLRWRTVRSPPRPFLSVWQARTLAWFGISLLMLLPLAFTFTRRLTRPIRQLADAVERLDHGTCLAQVPIEGPAELRLTARALNAMQARLAETLRERNAMIGAIAHDLRTPLARIAFRIEAAPAALRDPVQADVEQMRAMVAATIGYLKTGTAVVERKPIDAGALVADIINQAAEMGADARFDERRDCVVAGDASALARLFQNLVDNALKYAGGVEASAERLDDGIRITFADRGPGIAPDLVETIFQPFARGEPSRSRNTGGLGLGLTIARAIASAHGGTLMARPRDGGGLVMECLLPAG